MEKMHFKRPADQVRAHIIEALKHLPVEPHQLTDTEVADWTTLYGDLRHDLATSVGLMAAEAVKRGISYVPDPDNVDGDGETVETVL